MDENFIVVVNEMFVQFYEEGIIYRVNRFVNWCIKFNIVLLNFEVGNKELIGCILFDVFGYDKKVEFGVIVYFKYFIEGLDEIVEVVIICIEMMFGDIGIVVYFNDVCYKYLVGKNVVYFFIEGCKFFIIVDEYVDMEFGIGVVKFILVYDFNDFIFGQKYNFEFINILIDDGLMNENIGFFKGQKCFDV